MKGKVSDAAIDAAAAAIAKVIGHGMREKCTGLANAALEAALPHLQPAKPEAVRLRDELRERAEFEASYRSLDMTRDGQGYSASDTNYTWSVWQAALAATGKQQVGEVQGSDFDDAELQFYREEVGNLDGLLCMLGVMEITHDGDYTAAWKNTIEAVERLAARQQDQT